ncbi:hypothetical protein IV203_032644 [Nitzschia inconspicua]|uniref:Uncharacterized protein n=1 Tax=Nitzschia inconspicua TaxID=303405 RepID=A0A9K3KK07_9STRA|nr:hypothetical protein IV203_032644 [Nitzschia inconspicua]
MIAIKQPINLLVLWIIFGLYHLDLLGVGASREATLQWAMNLPKNVAFLSKERQQLVIQKDQAALVYRWMHKEDLPRVKQNSFIHR